MNIGWHDNAVVAAGIGLAGTLTAGLLGAVRYFAQIAVSAGESANDRLVDEIARANVRIGELEHELVRQNGRIDDLMRENMLLRTQVETMRTRDD